MDKMPDAYKIKAEEIMTAWADDAISDAAITNHIARALRESAADAIEELCADYMNREAQSMLTHQKWLLARASSLRSGQETSAEVKP